MAAFSGAGDVLFLDLGGGDMSVHFIIHYTVYLHLMYFCVIFHYKKHSKDNLGEKTHENDNKFAMV